MSKMEKSFICQEKIMAENFPKGGHEPSLYHTPEVKTDFENA